MRTLKAFATVLAILLGSYISPGQSDRIHHGDVVDVDIVGSIEYDWRGSLTPEGFLDGLDSIEEQVFALCRTEGEVSAAIQKEFAKMLREPKVDVRIVDRSNRAVAFLSGAVRTPQRFQIKRPVTLSELLALSGGITDRSSGEISIFRPANLSCVEPQADQKEEFLKASSSSGGSSVKIKIVDILRGEPSANPTIVSGDIITVNEAHPVYMIGGISAPQQLSLRNEITLSRAVSMAGGLAKDGKSTVTIYRREGKEPIVIKADLTKIAAGTEEDPVLRPFDIVDVPQSGRPARVRPPMVDERVGPQNKLATLPLRVID